ncbi:MAG: hypothetical protein MUD12_12150 [Spirochaetes bacterium]|jgi:hypothetical protein|nr:hypothetical protein [Spirochaetota bacterium]
MNQDSTKDRRINIRLDEDTFFALKKIVEKDLKTDISSYCRSLLWISTLHDASIHKIKTAVERWGRETNTDNLEFMLAVKDEIEFMDKFLSKMKEDRKKYDEFISMVEKWHESIKNEARKYYRKHNELIELCEKQGREHYGDEYDTNPTIARGFILKDKIDI